MLTPIYSQREESQSVGFREQSLFLSPASGEDHRPEVERLKQFSLPYISQCYTVLNLSYLRYVRKRPLERSRERAWIAL